LLIGGCGFPLLELYGYSPFALPVALLLGGGLGLFAGVFEPPELLLPPLPTVDCPGCGLDRFADVLPPPEPLLLLLLLSCVIVEPLGGGDGLGALVLLLGLVEFGWLLEVFELVFGLLGLGELVLLLDLSCVMVEPPGFVTGLLVHVLPLFEVGVADGLGALVLLFEVGEADGVADGLGALVLLELS
jgi:hypothetical protein